MQISNFSLCGLVFEIVLSFPADEEDELDGHAAGHAADAAGQAARDTLRLRRAQRRQARQQQLAPRAALPYPTQNKC